LAAIAVVAFWPAEREPEYNGKKLSEWLEVAGNPFWTTQDPFQRAKEIDRYASAEVKDAVSAVRVIGTNALPWLLKWAAEDREKWENSVMKTGEKLPRFLHAYPIALSIVRTSGRKRGAAFVGFAVLGQEAAPAVPELVALVENSKSERCRMVAMSCLGVLGNTARPTLPCLKKHAWFKRYRAGERFCTVQVIRNIEESDSAAGGAKNY
jgi:hypothetical protein